MANVSVTIPVTVAVSDSLGMPAEGIPVYAFSSGSYSSYHGTSDADGKVVLTLPLGDYRFRADSNGTQFWSGELDHCSIPGCLDVAVEITLPVTVTVADSGGAPLADLPVYAFDESTYTGFNATTDASGEVSLTLPPGEYRFRADSGGTQFWSGESNHCTVPDCTTAGITVTVPLTVTVLDTDGQPAEGLPVYAFNETTYTGFHAATDANGQVSLTLPQGGYRFRSDKNGTQFWSGESNHCTLPGCTEAGITVTLPVTVTVVNTDGQPAEGLPVYAFDETTYSGYHATTDAAGQVSLTLPQGGYRFRSDLNGTKFWSGESNHCAVPGCSTAGITVTLSVTVTVQSQTGDPYPGLPLYAFSADNYTGFHGTTDENGQVVLTLPQGDYRFRADYDGVHFWSGEIDHCVIPGCLTDAVELPGGGETAPQSVTIDYTYDPLYRLTAADYDTGEYFHYTYDEAGNRLTQETLAGTNSYTYDIANRLIEVDGASYTWSDTGNLLFDSESTYTYDHANRLSSVAQGEDTYTYVYNGQGDRLSQIVNGETTDYTLDTVKGLTQVLDDGMNAYLYGLDRVGEEQPAGWAYHIPDALGSVRQLTDANANVTLAQSYEPFGSVLSSSGLGDTNYSFTGEWADGTGLMNLRARYYQPMNGRFLSSDLLNGSTRIPMSQNKWLYGLSNPIIFIDPSGLVYDRAAAVSFAKLWDQDDMGGTFPSATDVFKDTTAVLKAYYYYDKDWGIPESEVNLGFLWEDRGDDMPPLWTDCANFASHVLWQGGIRDEISEPLTDNPIKSLHEHYLTTGDDNYWNPKLMLGKALYYANQAHIWEIAHPETLNPFSNWVVSDDLLKFLVKGHATEITKFSGNIPLFNGSNQEWDRELNNKWMMYLLSENIMIGDLVFYDTGDATTEAGTTFKWEHVAVIVGWGPQTYHDVIPTDEIFPSTLGDALWMWLLSRCRVFEWKPRVVDRSGEIQYNGSRSIDNTSNQIVDMQILHINQ